jgi:hypothetical protein
MTDGPHRTGEGVVRPSCEDDLTDLPAPVNNHVRQIMINQRKAIKR